jgi:NAD+ diphosphatase
MPWGWLRLAGVARPAQTLPHLVLAGFALDRDATRRGSPHLLKELLADPGTRVVEIRGDTARVSASRDGLRLALRGPEAGDADRLAVYLGLDAGHTAYLCVAATDAEPEGDDWQTLRQVAAQLPEAEAGLLATSLALANWHSAHGHCPRCGTRTEPDQAGWIRRCPADDSEHYPRTDPAVIMSVVADDGRLLLARGAKWGVKRYSVLAGFVEPGETLAAAVRREVREEVGIDVDDVTYLGDQPWPFPTSLMIGFTARARTTELVFRDGEIAEALWATRDELRDRVSSGEWGISPRLSIARRLIEHWYGEPITFAR